MKTPTKEEHEATVAKLLEGATCKCESCLFSRAFRIIRERCPELHFILNDIWTAYETEATDSQYYRERYQGTWPGQTVEHENDAHRRRIENIQKRVVEEASIEF